MAVGVEMDERHDQDYSRVEQASKHLTDRGKGVGLLKRTLTYLFCLPRPFAR